MSGILAILGGKVGVFALGAIIPLVFIAAKKFLPTQLGKILSNALAKEMNTIGEIKDEKRRALIKAIAIDLVKLAEYEIPDAGHGSARYAKVAAKLCEIIPFFKGQDEKVKEIIEAAVKAMDEELKKAANG